jgi:hypothetical protein
MLKNVEIRVSKKTKKNEKNRKKPKKKRKASAGKPPANEKNTKKC